MSADVTGYRVLEQRARDVAERARAERRASDAVAAAFGATRPDGTDAA
jgi:hypothetical protein